MSHTYDTKRPAHATSVPGPSMEALRSGAAAPSQAQLGRSVTMPDAVRSKMEQSFGADLSSVRLYESQAVADAGAHAMSQGSRIAFAPGMLDFTSQSGQQLLGHELSHVVSQSRGEVRGSGFLQNASLEARADREGAMAAAGKPVFAGAVSAAVSGMSAAADSGPVQAAGKPQKQDPTEQYVSLREKLMDMPMTSKKYKGTYRKAEDTYLKAFPGRSQKDFFQDYSNYGAHRNDPVRWFYNPGQ